MVDAKLAIGADGNHNLARVLFLGGGIRNGKIQLHLGEFAVGGGEHQKDEHYQQHVDERNQVDFWLRRSGAAKFQAPIALPAPRLQDHHH